MKKIIKLFRFSVIGLLVFCVFAFVGRFVFQFLWGFNILDKNDYNTLYNFWEKGGSFKTFKDITFIVSLIAFPIVWFIASKKLYKFGLGKFLLLPKIIPKKLDFAFLNADAHIRLFHYAEKKIREQAERHLLPFPFILLHPPVQLVVRLFGLRLPYPLSGGFLLSLLLGLIGKWILAWHNSSIFCKNKANTSHYTHFVV